MLTHNYWLIVAAAVAHNIILVAGSGVAPVIHGFVVIDDAAVADVTDDAIIMLLMSLMRMLLLLVLLLRLMVLMMLLVLLVLVFGIAKVVILAGGC